MNNQKGLWTVLIIILIVLVIWGVVATSNHGNVTTDEQSTTTVSTENSNSTNNPVAKSLSNPAPNPNVPIITSLNPAAAPAGNPVSINGFNFTHTDNKVIFAGFQVAKAISNDSNHVSFTVPVAFRACDASGNCSPEATPIQPGSYYVTVINSNGVSNQSVFVVTASTIAR